MPNQSELLQTLTALVATNVALSTIMPPVLRRITDRIENPNHKKQVIWGLCFALSFLFAAAQGAFNPVVDLWQGVPHTGVIGVMKAVWNTFLIIAASFGTLLTITGQMYERFYKPNKEVKEARAEARATALVVDAANQVRETGRIMATSPLVTGPGSVVNSLQEIASGKIAQSVPAAAVIPAIEEDLEEDEETANVYGSMEEEAGITFDPAPNAQGGAHSHG